ncbi:MAG: histone deacetylase [Actinobacteria bacterium]|nr:histone deacetylase [Actinomycetota bacterium]
MALVREMIDSPSPCKVTVVYHQDFGAHGYPALKGRVAPAFEELGSRGLLDLEGVRVMEATPADDDLAAEVHSESHLRGVKASGYYDIALLSAGSVVMGASEAGEGRALSSFCFVGAAGHHASHDGFWGFCFLNDVAMAVTHLRERSDLRRFAIIDIDPHFGDGTRDILGPDAEVLHVNFHSGHPMIKGEGLHNLDIALPHNADDRRFLEGVGEALEAARAFEHDLLFVIFGHDSHRDDYGAFELGDGVYASFARKVKEVFPERVCYVLSGGADARVARRAIGDVIEVLAR